MDVPSTKDDYITAIEEGHVLMPFTSGLFQKKTRNCLCKIMQIIDY